MAAAQMRSLADIELFAGVDTDRLAALEQACAWRICKRKEQVLSRNSDSRDVYFVVEGAVQIVSYSLSGREIGFASVARHQYFGELSAIDGEPRSADVVALEPCLLAALPPGPFNDFLSQSPTVCFRLLRRLSGMVRTSDERIMDLTTLGAVQRIYRELLRLAEPDPVTAGAAVIYPLPTQNAIAARTGTTRETVARVLSQLKKGGVTRKQEKALLIEDRARLELLLTRLGED